MRTLPRISEDTEAGGLVQLPGRRIVRRILPQPLVPRQYCQVFLLNYCTISTDVHTRVGQLLPNTPSKLFQQTPVISEDTDAGGSFNFLAAGESGEFYAVRLGVEAGGRTPDADGFQTFGGVCAVARYVKIEAVPASGGAIVISEASRLVLRCGYVYLPAKKNVLFCFGSSVA